MKTSSSSSLSWRHLYQAAYVEVRSWSSRRSVKIVTSPLILTVLKMKVRDDPRWPDQKEDAVFIFTIFREDEDRILLFLPSPLSYILEIFLSSCQNKNVWLTTNAVWSFLSVRCFYDTFKIPKVSRFQIPAVTSSLFIGANARIPIVTKRSTNSYVGFRDDPCCSLYFIWCLMGEAWRFRHESDTVRTDY